MAVRLCNFDDILKRSSAASYCGAFRFLTGKLERAHRKNKVEEEEGMIRSENPRTSKRGKWSLFFTVGCLVTSTSRSTGYYFGVRGDYTRKKVGDSIKPFLKDLKDNVGGVTLFSGYMYSPFSLSLAGQVYFGFQRQGDLVEKTVDKVTYKCQLWNRWNTGAEVLLGKSLSIITAYGLLGLQCSMVQMRGYKVENKNPKEISFYGKDAQTIENVSFAKLQPPRNFVLTPTLGGGIRLNIQTVFVGIEARHAFANDRKIHMKVSRASGNTVTSTAKKVDEKHKIGGTTFSLAVGVRL